MPSTRAAKVLLGAVALVTCSWLLPACGADDGNDGGGGAGQTQTEPWLPDGEYFVGIELVDFSGVRLKLKAVVASAGEKGRAGKLGKLELYGLAVAPDDPWVQAEPMATLHDLPIAADGTFTADFGHVTVPGKAVPTTLDTEVRMILEAKIHADGSFCGMLKGEVPDFDKKLEKSTFKAVKLGTQDPIDYEVTCEAKVAHKYAPIQSCPELAEGDNKLTSAELERRFVLRLPKGVTGTADLPVVFLYHGVNGTPEKFEAETRFGDLLEDHSFILVIPASARIEGKKETLDWFFTGPQYDTDNRDLVFFDDTLKCLGEQWKIDRKRVYVTGMSGGGLMSTFIAANRGEVVAAAAPFSGGYLHPQWPNTRKTPFMVSWGGPEDSAYSQNFDTLAHKFIALLEGAGSPVVKCDHGLEHKWPPTASRDTWEFLRQFTFGGGEKPDLGKLPKYCE